MKYLFVALGLAFLFSSCSTPGVADFTDAQTPLEKDEYLTIWRFTHHPSNAESLDTTAAHFERWEKEMEPLFAQLMPKMFADIKAGKLTVHEYKAIEDMSEYPIEDFASYITQFYDSNWQKIASFMQIIQFSQRRKSDKKGFPAQELKWEIIYKDPEEKRPEIRVGFVFMKDLLERNYKIEVDGESYDLISYLDKVQDFGFPIYFGDQAISEGLISLEEAFNSKALILDGRWKEIEWQENGRPTHNGIPLN